MYNMIFEINGWISFEFNRRYITRFLYSYLFFLLSYSQWRISLYNYQKHLPIHNLEAMILDLNWTGSYIICFQTWKEWLLNLFDALTIPWVFPQQQWTWTACSQAIYMFFLTIFGILQTELFPRKCSQVGVPDVTMKSSNDQHILIGLQENTHKHPDLWLPLCMCLSICMLCLNSPELHQLLHILQLGLPWTGDRSRTHRGAQLKRPSLCHSSHWDKPLALIWVRPLQGGRGRWYLEWGQARNMRPKSRRMQCRQPNEELLLSECAIDRSLQG